MASRWGRSLAVAFVVLAALPGQQLSAPSAAAGVAPRSTPAPDDPDATSQPLAQGAMVHVFDTTTARTDAHYVNDHTLVRGDDGRWHLFGIFHAEPMGDDSEIDLVHAVSDEPDPSRWKERSFTVANAPYEMALRADRNVGETHLWAPHVVRHDGRWLMTYQGGGTSDYRASIRFAESDDLYRWSRIGAAPAFEDFCAARDPMLVRQGDLWALYYTRCESIARKVSGVAYRLSRDLVAWSDARMALTTQTPPTSNSAFTESPFLFTRGRFHYLTVTAYPLAWDATLVYRSTDPLSFPDAPFSRIRAHAAEWIEDPRGGLWATHAGPGQRGVWVSPITGL